MAANINHPALITAIRTGYQVAQVMPAEVAADHVREIRRSWRDGWIAGVHNSLFNLGNDLDKVDGAEGRRAELDAARFTAIEATK
jgi:hypothetical protein